MNIKIICIGKIKDDYLKNGLMEYEKRLGRFCNIKIVELPDKKIPDKASQAECDAIIKAEGEQVFRYINKGDYVVSLCVEGKRMSSEKLADSIKEIVQTASTITFIIGGSLGLDDSVKNVSKLKLSLSDMTFPHQLTRLILLEQIYRAFKINSNETYHK